MYKYLLKPLLFRLDPERAHYFTVGLLKFLFMLPFVRSIFYASYNVNHPSLEREVFGLKFKNPVGLAAGFDKDAKLVNQLAFAGFGFIEVGTVTPKPQPGNPKPRLFRLPLDFGLINRMGFNNGGVKKMRKRLESRYASIIVGGNIGKNKTTPNENAIDDYVNCFEELYFDVDYFTVNVSSPNTPNLRELQDKEPLKRILNKLVQLNQSKPKQKPILLKIAPDLTSQQLDDIIEIVLETKIDGVIATNTTISRSGLKTSEEEIEKIGTGGLSGIPVRSRSTEVIRYLSENSNRAFPIIGVGGIHSAKDAIEKLNAGACLIQVYTGYIYEGPALVKKINKELISYAQNN